MGGNVLQILENQFNLQCHISHFYNDYSVCHYIYLPYLAYRYQYYPGVTPLFPPLTYTFKYIQNT